MVNRILSVGMYILFLNRQDMHSQMFHGENILTNVVGLIYSVDINTGV